MAEPRHTGAVRARRVIVLATLCAAVVLAAAVMVALRAGSPDPADLAPASAPAVALNAETAAPGCADSGVSGITDVAGALCATGKAGAQAAAAASAAATSGCTWAGGCGGVSPRTTTTTAAPSTTTTTPVPAPAAAPEAPAAPSGPCAGTVPPIAAPSGTWHCTFDDEFNGTSLDAAKWQPIVTRTSGYQSGTLFAQVCYVDNPQTISESGGYLRLSVANAGHNFTCAGPALSFDTNYEGGMIASYQRFSQRYGYFEVRAEMPPTSVPGLQETLWLYPENETLYGPWPDSGEIDYGEFYSAYSGQDWPAIHYPGSGNDPNATTTTGCAAPDHTPAGQFNTYALSWTPTTLTTYFDGVPCITDVYAPYVSSPDTAPEPFDQPFFLAFTSAFGMNSDAFNPWSTPLPATTTIDWVRVWQY